MHAGSFADTIVALATPQGVGALAVIRLSGSKALAIANKIFYGKDLPQQASHTVHVGTIRDNDTIIDEVVIALFKGPKSFTKEDIVEITCHGSMFIVRRIVMLIIHHGARMANPGEFTQRAFLNGQFDLTQAEAIADLIAAESEQSAKAAMHSLQGEFSASIDTLLKQLIELRMHVESTLDFPEEEIDFLADDIIKQKLLALIDQLQVIQNNSKQGRLLNEGLKVVISGKPNAGKSSLLNLLAGNDSAIVSDIPGTTRDVLREKIQIQGVPLHIVDTAGLREASDVIEQEGVRRAQKEMQQADILLTVIDATTDTVTSEAQPNEIQVLNKIDLLQHNNDNTPDNVVKLSAKTGEGLELLQQKILQLAGYNSQPGQVTGLYTARRRHLQALQKTAEHLKLAQRALLVDQAGEVMAEELRLAQSSLSEITGAFSSDDLLGKIFSEFCIGK